MTRASTNRRIVLLAAAFVTILGIALARAFWLQVVNGNAYAAMAVRQHRETVVVPAARGTIFDRNGEPLAIGERTTTVYANPRQVDQPKRLTLAAAEALDLQPAAVYPLLIDRSRGFVYIARKVDPLKAAELEELGFAGLGFYPEELRTYPQGPVASQVLGYAGLDNKGLEGLERSLEKVIAGRPGSQTVVKDPFGRALDVVSTEPETQGRNVRLTIDHQVQANAEADSLRDGPAVRCSSGLRDRDGSAYGSGVGNGHGARLQRESLPDDPSRSPAQPSSDGYL